VRELYREQQRNNRRASKMKKMKFELYSPLLPNKLLLFVLICTVQLDWR